MDQYTMYLLFPVRRYQSMMTFIRLSDWWILTFSIEDCTPANAPLLRKMDEISYFCHICKRICLYLMMSVVWNESKQELIDICLYDLFKYRICYIQILSIRPHFRSIFKSMFKKNRKVQTFPETNKEPIWCIRTYMYV